MEPAFIKDIATWAVTVLVSAGTVGGFFWVLLQKALDARFTQLLEKHKVDLAVSLHMQNTVYSRIDQQRSDAVQKINALVRRYRWMLLEFSPKSSFKTGADRTSPDTDAIVWCFQLQSQANEVLQTVMDLSMLLPDELVKKILFGWYPLANGMATELIPVFFSVRDSTEFQAGDDNSQRRLLKQAKQEAHVPQQDGLTRVTNSIIEDLRGIFTAVGTLPESTPIPPAADVKPPK